MVTTPVLSFNLTYMSDYARANFTVPQPAPAGGLVVDKVIVLVAPTATETSDLSTVNDPKSQSGF